LLCAQYAVHAHFQKIPALFGQLKWRQAARQHAEIGLVDYKQDTAQNTFSVKALAARVLAPLAWCQRLLVTRGLRVWHLAQLQEGIGRRVDASNVVMGHVELHGTRNIQFGRNALIYPGVYLETQGAGSITVGDGVVLSRGVHIVAFERVTLGNGCMVGEYASIRDANHTLSNQSIRDAGHVSSPVDIGQNTWLGRGTAVLLGAGIGANSVVGANAVVTKALGPHQIVGGIPARSLHAH